LDDALDLVLAPDDGVELAFACQLGQVAPEGVERRRLALALALLAPDRLLALLLFLFLAVLGAEELEYLLAHVLELDAQVREHLGGDALVLLDEAEQEVLGADVIVPEVAG